MVFDFDLNNFDYVGNMVLSSLAALITFSIVSEHYASREISQLRKQKKLKRCGLCVECERIVETVRLQNAPPEKESNVDTTEQPSSLVCPCEDCKRKRDIADEGCPCPMCKDIRKQKEQAQAKPRGPVIWVNGEPCDCPQLEEAYNVLQRFVEIQKGGAYAAYKLLMKHLGKKQPLTYEQIEPFFEFLGAYKNQIIEEVNLVPRKTILDDCALASDPENQEWQTGDSVVLKKPDRTPGEMGKVVNVYYGAGCQQTKCFVQWWSPSSKSIRAIQLHDVSSLRKVPQLKEREWADYLCKHLKDSEWAKDPETPTAPDLKETQELQVGDSVVLKKPDITPCAVGKIIKIGATRDDGLQVCTVQWSRHLSADDAPRSVSHDISSLRKATSWADYLCKHNIKRAKK